MEPLTWIEISRGALWHNITAFRQRLSPGASLLAVVKANAYGHGLRVVARSIAAHVDWLGVNTLDEALALHNDGITTRHGAGPLRVLIMGFTPHSRAAEVVRLGFRQVVFDQAAAACLAQAAVAQNVTAAVHVKIETGTYRLGVGFQEALPFLRQLQSLPHLTVEGIYTHFATAEDTADDSYLQLQISRFAEAQAALARAGMGVTYQHMAATAATVVAPAAHGRLARIGIGLYGLWPSLDTKIAMTERSAQPLTLRPVMQWKTRIVHIQNVARGETVGYGRTYRTRRDSNIAVIPVGYSDGYDRKLSNVGKVAVRRRLAAVVGRVMMNMTLIDVTDIPGVQVGDEVTLLGTEIPAEHIATHVGTINYEIVSRINPALPRIAVP
ncbi:MAG: alanine racemase [Chloroflexi bacterium]|nr:alanine racemase [Chloroflexota bacterium]